MKRNIAIYLLAAFMCACTPDKGNYDYTTVNEVTIGGIRDNYTAEVFSQFTVDPVITGTEGFAEEDFDYLWVLWGAADRENPADTVGRSKKLEIDIDADYSIGSYSLRLLARERATGLLATARTTLNVVNSGSVGLMILNDMDGAAAVTFINTLGTVTEDLYLMMNGERAGRLPVAIEYSAGYVNTFPSVFLMTGEESGGLIIEPANFTPVMEMGDIFYYAPEKVQPQTLLRGALQDFFICDGRPHLRLARLVAYPKFGLDAKGDYYCAPYIFFGSEFCFLYDQKHGRFLQFDGEIHDVIPTQNLFNPTDMGMQMVWGKGVIKADPDSEFFGTSCKVRAVMERPDGSRCLISATAMVLAEINMETWSVDFYNYVTPTALAEFPATDITAFAVSDDDENFLFYADGSTIHCKSFITGNILASYDAGRNVDYMEFGSGDRSNILYVGTSNGSAAAGSGSVLYLRMASDGSLTEVDRFDNICGKVVDFSWKP